MNMTSAFGKSFRPAAFAVFLAFSSFAVPSQAAGLDDLGKGLLGGVLGVLANGVAPGNAQPVVAGAPGVLGSVGRQSSVQGTTPVSTRACLQGICIGDPLSKLSSIPWLFDETQPSYKFSSKEQAGLPAVVRVEGNKTERGWFGLTQLNGESIAALYSVQSWCEQLPSLVGRIKTEDGSLLIMGARALKLPTGQLVYYVTSLHQEWRGAFSNAQFAEFEEQVAKKFAGAAYIMGRANPGIANSNAWPAVNLGKANGLLLLVDEPSVWVVSNPPGDLRGSPGCTDKMNIQIR